MKGLRLLVLAVVLTGCGAVGQGGGTAASSARQASDARTATSVRTQPPACEVAPATVIAPLVSGGSLPAGPSTAPEQALAVMFGLSAVAQGSYTIQLVDVNGNVVASAQAHMRSKIAGTCGNDAQPYRAMPLISTSRGRVYFLDGDNEVRYLAPDGSSGDVMRVPGSSQSASLFAVSPDDRRIAVASFDYAAHPARASLAIEDLGGGNRIDLAASSVGYRWPVGWHGGDIIVASDGTPAPAFGYYGALPYRLTSLQVLDPSTGRAVSTLNSTSCKPTSTLPTPAGIACETDALAVGRLDWSGNATIFANGDSFTGGASLSPDGTELLASGTGALLRLIDSPETGSAAHSLGATYAEGAGGYPGDGGWIDDTHCVYRRAGTPTQYIIEVHSGATVALPRDTALAARLPGGY